MSTGCEFYSDALVDLGTGTMDPQREERVREHLVRCEDCRAELEVIRAVRTAQAPRPEGLEERLAAAVIGTLDRETDAQAKTPGDGRADAFEAGTGARPATGAVGRRRFARAWALPLAAAAAAAVWLGAIELLGPTDLEVETGELVRTDWDPYGALPAEGGVVAGEVVLSDLSVEELETLLEEMQS